MSDFAYEASVWNKRVQVALDAGNQLAQLGGRLGDIASANYFGVGCEEGSVLYDRLRRLIDESVRAVTISANEALALSAQCTAAGKDFPAADAMNATELARKGSRS
ncbi:hypothetical protein [Gordonia sp. MMO-8]|uniref:hypothetical protein n=1 Tax=Gordonia sp. MMO-8 TaxID=3127886 RepID=UPI003017CC71